MRSTTSGLRSQSRTLMSVSSDASSISCLVWSSSQRHRVPYFNLAITMHNARGVGKFICEQSVTRTAAVRDYPRQSTLTASSALA